MAQEGEVRARFAYPVEAFPKPCEGPNGMQWSNEGLWVVDQVLDDAYLLDESGKVLRKLRTVTENSSGVTVGGGYLWTASNGTTALRPFRSTDTHRSAVLKLNPWDGGLLDRFPTTESEYIHGIEWDNGLMWITAFSPESLVLVEPRDFRVVRKFLVHMKRPHGLAVEGDGIWCAHTSDKVILKYHKESGRVIDSISLPKDGPAPHGLAIRNGELWYCDIAPMSGIYRVVMKNI